MAELLSLSLSLSLLPDLRNDTTAVRRFSLHQYNPSQRVARLYAMRVGSLNRRHVPR
jgi:hypothetical protein